MTLQLYNTLTKNKSEFVPIDSHNVGMYVCGPTVYDRAHIGNARAMVVFDILYRTLCHEFGIENVTYVRNITDVDDKINARAQQRKIDIKELTQETTNWFHEDMETIGCIALHTNDHGSKRQEPKATDHIDQMIEMINTLIDNNHAYAAQGHVLFKTQSFSEYGKLSRRSEDQMIAGARVEIAPYKENPSDFVLWKPSSDSEPGWESPWGRGRPGWHLECSVMSTNYLGPTFDIHGGGADLQFPHHENEIAQSCCAYPNSHYAKTWVHNGFLTVEGEKMSKSLGNFITVNELTDQGIQGEVIRFVLMSTHYRKPLDWSDKNVADATKALNGFYELIKETNLEPGTPDSHMVEALYDDLNTPKAIANLHAQASKLRKNPNNEELATFIASCQLIGLLNQDADSWFNSPRKEDIDEDYINSLLEKRKQARAEKDWPTADQVRDELAKLNIIVKDNPDGSTSWTKQ